MSLLFRSDFVTDETMTLNYSRRDPAWWRAGRRAGGRQEERAGLRQLPSVSRSPAESTEGGLVEVTC